MNLGWSLCGFVGSKLLSLGHEEDPRQERGAWIKLTRGVYGSSHNHYHTLDTLQTSDMVLGTLYTLFYFILLIAPWCGCSHQLYLTSQGTMDKRSRSLPKVTHSISTQ